jgi:diadenosine tetraphosphate (Ap4A) HIT family hydrolase
MIAASAAAALKGQAVEAGDASAGVLLRFREKFRLPELEIHSNRFWTWSVRPEQPTLGAGVLSLRRPCPHFGQVSRAEGAALSKIVAVAERSLGRAVAPDRINYLMLMMVDHHVHFHVIPRYARPISAFGREWRDPDWPSPPQLSPDANEGGTATLIRLRELLASGAV